MNLILLLLSLLCSHLQPSNVSSDDGPNNGNNTTQAGPGKGKGGKFGDGDYIIYYDIMP